MIRSGKTLPRKKTRKKEEGKYLELVWLWFHGITVGQDKKKISDIQLLQIELLKVEEDTSVSGQSKQLSVDYVLPIWGSAYSHLASIRCQMGLLIPLHTALPH